MSKQSKLDILRAEILEQKICSQLAEQAKNLVMGDGNPDADVVFIGEAPGKNEDEQGLPFVGAAGKFLNEMLESVGMNRKDVYITNIVKYRPPNNRDPEPAEKTEFWPFLLRQLAIIQPKVIVTLGRHSMEYFLPDAKISQIHGQPRRIKIACHPELDSGSSKKKVARGGELSDWIPGQARNDKCFEWVVMPLYHPAAALYNGAMRETLLEDFAKLPAVVQQIQTREDVLKIMTEE